jgi:hypothetical protein
MRNQDVLSEEFQTFSLQKKRRSFLSGLLSDSSFLSLPGSSDEGVGHGND